jgi:hypothetical protein
MLRPLRALVATVLAALVLATAAPTGASQPSRPFTPVLPEPVPTRSAGPRCTWSTPIGRIPGGPTRPGS